MTKIKTLFNRLVGAFFRRVSPPGFAVLLTICVVTPLLFWGFYHGYADQGSFWRVLFPSGLYQDARTLETGSDYFTTRYNIMQYFNENEPSILTIQLLFVRFALVLNKLLYSRTVFDVRFLGFVYFALFLFAIYVLTAALTKKRASKWDYLIALIVVFVFADSGMTMYFNSFYQTPVLYIGFLTAVGSWLMIARGRYRKLWRSLTLYAVSNVVILTSQPHNVTIALCLAVVGLGLLAFAPKKGAFVYVLCAEVCVLAIGASTAFFSPQLDAVGSYQAFTKGVLKNTATPGSKIEAAGVDSKYALMRDEMYYPATFAALLPKDKLVKKQLLAKNTLPFRVRYYAAHPAQLNLLLDEVSRNQMIVQPPNVGNNMRAQATEPKAKTHYFTAQSRIVQTFFPRRYQFTVLLAVTIWIIYGIGAYLDWKKGSVAGPMRFSLTVGLTLLMLLIPIATVLQYGVSDLTQHLVVVPIAFNLLLVLTVAEALLGRLWQASLEEEDEN